MKKLFNLAVLVFFFLISSSVFAAVSNADLKKQYRQEAKTICKKRDDLITNVNCFNLAQKLADLNDPEASFYLGLVYDMDTPVVKQNFDLAIKYMSQAAQSKYKNAEQILIEYKVQGLGSTSDEEVIKLRAKIQALLQTNLPVDQKIDYTNSLIMSYMSSRKNLTDFKKAEYYATQILSLPLSESQKNVLSYSCMVISLHYVVYPNYPNPKKTFQWMQTAANLGSKEAYYNLSDLYFYGVGTPISFKKSYQMTKIADKMPWAPFPSEHTKHVFGLYTRLVMYTIAHFISINQS